MNKFIEEARKETNIAFTENGALSNRSSLSCNLDFFSKSGALRGANNEALSYFIKAYGEDKSLALKALFYSRDPRGGQGERSNFRTILSWLADNHTEDLFKNIKYIPEFGRWDDIIELLFTTRNSMIRKSIINFIDYTLNMDALFMSREEPISLLSKWLPSENTSSKTTVLKAKAIRTMLKLSSRNYRKMLSKFRKYLDVVERKMSANRWKEIEYSSVPSIAMKNYNSAFLTHDNKGFNLYLEKVKNGEEKINASVLYPYELVNKVYEGGYNDTVEQLWQNLPDYMNGENSIAVVDVSGSMEGGSSSIRPIDISVSLGIYFAERSKGKFKDYFITFSSNPLVEKIVGTNLKEKVENLNKAYWEMSTNLTAVFEALLTTAKRINATQEDVPSKVYIISDMQFNEALPGKTNYAYINKLYEEAGYKRPELVFWNVNAYSNIPVTKDEEGTFLVSGASPSILKYAMNCNAVTPEQFMFDVLNSERYKMIEAA